MEASSYVKDLSDLPDPSPQIQVQKSATQEYFVSQGHRD